MASQDPRQSGLPSRPQPRGSHAAARLTVLLHAAVEGGAERQGLAGGSHQEVDQRLLVGGRPAQCLLQPLGVLILCCLQQRLDITALYSLRLSSTTEQGNASGHHGTGGSSCPLACPCPALPTCLMASRVSSPCATAPRRQPSPSSTWSRKWLPL